MKRREIIKSIGFVSPFALVPGLSMAKSNGTNSWLKEFTERWDVSELYTREVFNAMPDKFLDFKPVPDVMSFGKQFSHLAMSNSVYATVIKNGDIHLDEPDNIERQVIYSYLEETSNEFQSVLSGLDEADLYSKDHKHKNEDMWKDFSIGDILLLAYHHTAHHRGQAIVYLRLKGIEPPKYRF